MERGSGCAHPERENRYQSETWIIREKEVSFFAISEADEEKLEERDGRKERKINK